MAPEVTSLASPLIQELTGLHKEVLRLWRSAGGGFDITTFSDHDGHGGVRDVVHLRTLLAEKEAQYQRQEVELRSCQGALEEARLSNKELRERMEDMESQVLRGEKQLAEATKAVASLRPWLQHLNNGSAHGVMEELPGVLLNADAILGKQGGHCRLSAAPTEADPNESMVDSTESSSGVSDKASLSTPKGDAIWEPLLDDELNALEQQMDAVAAKTHHHAPGKEERHLPDGVIHRASPSGTHRAHPATSGTQDSRGLKGYRGTFDCDDAAIAQFQVACVNFARRARTLAATGQRHQQQLPPTASQRASSRRREPSQRSKSKASSQDRAVSLSRA